MQFGFSVFRHEKSSPLQVVSGPGSPPMAENRVQATGVFTITQKNDLSGTKKRDFMKLRRFLGRKSSKVAQKMLKNAEQSQALSNKVISAGQNIINTVKLRLGENSRVSKSKKEGPAVYSGQIDLTKAVKTAAAESKKVQTKMRLTEKLKGLKEKRWNILLGSVLKIDFGNPFARVYELYKTLKKDEFSAIGNLMRRSVKAFQETKSGRLIVCTLVALTIFNFWSFSLGTAGLALGALSLFAGSYLSENIEAFVGWCVQSAAQLQKVNGQIASEELKQGVKTKPVSQVTQWVRAKVLGRPAILPGEVGSKSIEEKLENAEKYSRIALHATIAMSFFIPLIGGIIAGYCLKNS